MAAMLPITGTVSISLAGSEALGLGTFSIPTSVGLDAKTGIATLEAASDDTIITAMAEALRSAADQILATLPSVAAETIAAPAKTQTRAKRRSNLHDPIRRTPRGFLVVVKHVGGRQSLTESFDNRLRGKSIACECCTAPEPETIAICPTCHAELGVMNSLITIEHGLNGGHIENHRY